MMTVVRATLMVPLIVSALLPGGIPARDEPQAADPIAIEQRMGKLQLAVDDLMKAKDWDGALASIKEGLALDPDHPMPYRQAVLMLRRRGALAESGKLIDALGPADGPGRRYGKGIALFVGERHAEAAEEFAQALDIYASRGHAAGQAACLTALGNLERQADRLPQALDRYAAAEDQLERIQDRQGLADLAANRARIERMLGRPLLAAEQQRRVLAIREALDDKQGQSRSWHEIGVCLLEGDDLPGARESFGQALAMRRATGDRAGEGTTLRMLADVAAGEGRDSEALDHLLAADTAFTEAKDRGGRAENLAELGKSLRRLGEFERARSTLETARALAIELKDRKLQAGILGDMAAVDSALHSVPAALSESEQAFSWFREAKDVRGQIVCLDTQVAIHHAVGDLATARRLMEARQTLAGSLEDPDLTAIGHNNLGVLMGELGEADAALAQLDRAEAIWRSAGHDRLLDRLECNRAEILLGQGRADEARSLLEKALARFRSRHEPSNEAVALNLLGQLEAARGRHEAALRLYGESLALARPLRLAEEEWRAHIGLAGSLQARGQRQEAAGHAIQAIDKVESVRTRLLGDAFKMRFLAGRMDLYERAVSILLSGNAGKTEQAAAQALEVVQRAKARGLLDLLAESRYRMRDRLPAELKQRELAGQDAVSAATVRLMSARNDAEAQAARDALERAEGEMGRLEIEIRAADPGYAEIVFPRPATARDVQAALDEDETHLEYFIVGDGAWVWVVTRKQVAVHRLPAPDLIRAAVGAYLEGASGPGAALAGDRKDPAAEKLAEMLLPAVTLRSSGRLLCAPDGPLHHIPFEALAVGDRFLIEEREVQTVPSATAMLWMRSARPSHAAHAFLGAGNPVSSDGTIPLPFSGEEIERIASLFDEPARRVLLGEQFSRAALVDPSVREFKFLHFATHGLLAEDDAAGTSRTGLWLGRGAGQEMDAILTLPEVAALQLDAELVVLSACRSGEGELVNGEGLVGLTRAFLHAGARSVVMALWDVSDQSSVDLMHSFYRNLVAGASPSAALRQAKLDFIRSDRPARREPYRWAPFVLVGTNRQ